MALPKRLASSKPWVYWGSRSRVRGRVVIGVRFVIGGRVVIG